MPFSLFRIACFVYFGFVLLSSAETICTREGQCPRTCGHHRIWLVGRICKLRVRSERDRCLDGGETLTLDLEGKDKLLQRRQSCQEEGHKRNSALDRMVRSRTITKIHASQSISISSAPFIKPKSRAVDGAPLVSEIARDTLGRTVAPDTSLAVAGLDSLSALEPRVPQFSRFESRFF